MRRRFGIQKRHMKTRVFITDDHAVTRLGLKALLDLAGFETVGEASDGRDALRQMEQLAPDVAIVDLTMPGLNGIETVTLLQHRCPTTRVVILSMHTDTEHVHRALAAGAGAYVVKGGASENIVQAINAVRLGRRYLSPELHAPDPEYAGTTRGGPIESLSARERQVLQLVVEGHSSVKIAQIIHLSPKSVDTYRSRLMRKLGVSDVTALVKFAVQHGITDVG
jgi:DNA-binding NarL/FixJ family response regulator